MATSKSDFTGLDVTGNTDLCEDSQWNAIARAVQGVTAIWQGKDSVNASEPNDILHGWILGAFGGANFASQRYRAADATHSILYKNTGTDVSPTWVPLVELGDGDGGTIFNSAVGYYDGTGPAGTLRWRSGFFPFTGSYVIQDVVNSLTPFSIDPTAPSSSLRIRATEIDHGNRANFQSGTVALPSIQFAGENTGFARPSANILELIVNAASVIQLTTSAVTIGKPVLGSNGSATFPAYSFSSDPNTGAFRDAADNYGIATGGTEAIRVDASQNVGIGVSSPAERLDVSGAIKYVPPQMVIARVATQSIPNATWSTITWDTENEDADGMFTAPGTTVIPTVTGFYTWTAYLEWAANATGIRMARFRIGGFGTLSGDTKAAAPLPEVSMVTIGYQRNFGTGLGYTIEVFQNSGGPLNIVKASWASQRWG